MSYSEDSGLQEHTYPLYTFHSRGDWASVSRHWGTLTSQVAEGPRVKELLLSWSLLQASLPGSDVPSFPAR